jgi:glycosyltransferase involved in cell wall biosynthesis
MLERIVHAISNPLLRSYSPKFHVFGVLSDPLYHKELENLADSLGVSDSLVFHGPYRSDADIQHQLSAGAVAHLFPLTFTPNPSNVESISSSNKFFSYATLGLPMLVHQSYTDMASTLATYHAGFSFFTLSEFVLRCDEVWSDHSRWLSLSHGSLKLAASMNNNVYEQTIRQLYCNRT